MTDKTETESDKIKVIIYARQSSGNEKDDITELSCIFKTF